MARKKKQFILKKNAAVFSLVHRSQRDPLYHKEDASKMVLLPVKGNTNNLIPEEALYQARGEIDYTLQEEGSDEEEEGSEEEDDGFRLLGDKVDLLGLPIDGYDYSQHLRELGGDGVVLDGNGRMLRREDDVMAKKVEADLTLPADVFPSEYEEERMLEAIAIDESLLDPEIRDVLAGGEGYEALQDDFIVEAMKEVEGEAVDEFDFDAHVARLMKNAERDDRRGERRWDHDDDDDELPIRRVTWKDMVDKEKDDDLECGSQFSSRTFDTSHRKQRVIDEQFEAVMEQYDEEEEDWSDGDNDTCRGGMSEEMLMSMMDEYLVMKQTERVIEQDGTVPEERDELKMRTLNLIEAEEADIVEECEDILVESCQDKSKLESDSSDEEEEEEEVTELQPLGAVEADNPAAIWLRPDLFAKEKGWDCETIISTYTNTENHPSVIFDMGRKGKIRLSAKTGLPLMEKQENVIKEEEEEDDEDEDDLVMEIPVASNHRNKNESKEEKQARKAAVKMQRAAKRELKRNLKQKYKMETAKVKASNPTDVDVTARPGQPVFKY